MRGLRLPLSIRTKLTLWYSGVLLAILVTIAAISYSWLSFGLQQDLDASLLTVAQVIKDTGSSEQASKRRLNTSRDVILPPRPMNGSRVRSCRICSAI